jgi:hypothetical protein
MGDKLELILKLLDFKIMNIIGHYTKYGQDFLDNEAFTYIPDIRKLGITDITESKFYKLLELTTDEIRALKYTNDEEIEINETLEDSEQTITIPKRVSKKKIHVQEPVVVESVIEQPIEPKIKPKRVLKIKANVEKIAEPIIQPPEPVVVEEVKPKKLVKKKLKLIEV